MKPKILIIGLSRIVRKRVLPALIQSNLFSSWSVATKSNTLLASSMGFTQVYNDYLQAISDCDAQWAYISLPNGMHAEYIEAALIQGLNVIVDKPAVMDPIEGIRMLSLARSKGLALSEALVIRYHPQIEESKKIFLKNQDRPVRISGLFGIPSLPNTDFRNDPVLGGGAFFDMGPYAIEMGSIFFNSLPKRISVITNDISCAANSGFCLIAEYPEGQTSVGHFSFNSEYVNEITVIGNKNYLRIPMIFSTPDTLQNTIDGRTRNEQWKLEIPKANSFRLYLEWCVSCCVPGAIEQIWMEFEKSNSAMALLLKAYKEGIR